MAVTFKCPDCGAPIKDDPNLLVLECKHCGNSVTKYVQNTTKIEMNVEEHRIVEDRAKIEEIKKDKQLLTLYISFTILLFIGLFIYNLIKK